jgi:hypothetical protein
MSPIIDVAAEAAYVLIAPSPSCISQRCCTSADHNGYAGEYAWSNPIPNLIYVNDLYNASALLKLMFADDTACVTSNSNLTNLKSFVTAELKKVSQMV